MLVNRAGGGGSGMPGCETSVGFWLCSRRCISCQLSRRPAAERRMEGGAESAELSRTFYFSEEGSPMQKNKCGVTFYIGRNNAVETPRGQITPQNRSSQVLLELCSPETRNDLAAVAALRRARTPPDHKSSQFSGSMGKDSSVLNDSWHLLVFWKIYIYKLCFRLAFVLF